MLQFTVHPPPYFAFNNKSSLRFSQFVDTAVSELLQGNLIRSVSVAPYCCNPLTVTLTAGKLRLVLDLLNIQK